MTFAPWKFGALATAMVLATATVPAFAGQCQLGKVGTLPILISGNQMLIESQINGHKTYALVDIGAEFTSIFQRTALDAGLDPVNVEGMYVIGVGGREPVKMVTVPEIRFGDFSIKDRRWYVIGDAKTDYGDTGMLLGNDIFSKVDVEIDLANKKMILWRPSDCEKSPLAYWTQDFMLAELETSPNHFMETSVHLNGKPVRAVLDTGAEMTIVSLAAAKRAGFQPGAPDVEAGPTVRSPGSPERLDSFIARFDSFEMGDLMVKNARIIVADLGKHVEEKEIGSNIKKVRDEGPDMYIGGDFLHAMRLFIAKDQEYIYMTHNGGQIFQTESKMSDVARGDGMGATDLEKVKRALEQGDVKVIVHSASGEAGTATEPSPELIEKLKQALESGELKLDSPSATKGDSAPVP